MPELSIQAINDAVTSDNESKDKTIAINLINKTPTCSFDVVMLKSKLNAIENKCKIADKIQLILRNDKENLFKSKYYKKVVICPYFIMHCS